MSRVREAEIALDQLDMPGMVTKLAGRLTGASRGATMAQSAPSFQGAPFLSERRAGRGAVTGTGEEGWQHQLMHAAKVGKLGKRS